MGKFRCSIYCLVLAVSLVCGRNAGPEVRYPVLAGTWYPAEAGALRAVVNGLLDEIKASAPAEKPLVLILPHAGYSWSGKVAAAGYNSLRGTMPDLVVILAPSHHSAFSGCSVLPVDWYETPLGRVRVAKDAVLSLLKKSGFIRHPHAHQQEHAIEIQLPFLQCMYGDRMEKDIPIIPVLVGDITDGDAEKAAHHISAAAAGYRSPLFIVSSDFTHYGARFGYIPFTASDSNTVQLKLKSLDGGAIACILRGDRKGFSAYIEKTGITMCGRNAVRIAMSLPLRDFSSSLLAYDTSCHISGDCSNSVSYAAIAIRGRLASSGTGPVVDGGEITPGEKNYLLSLARKSIVSYLAGGKQVAVNESSVPQSCRDAKGVFVTLKKNGALRGCIGFITGMKPLYQAVIENAWNAAFRDPRFPPLDRSELGGITIEISVLTEPCPVRNVDDIVVGRDGLIIRMGDRQGVFLPQVPVEWGWSREEYLIQLCRKAGLPDNAWRNGAAIYSFRAIVFGEGETA
ncbi:MAG TPA: AmmeMemoRadiSam system protein B [Spirochaetota bacterium]|nr:AmmeMemoRadiSam system protein B [Spirochaetota bacterium]